MKLKEMVEKYAAQGKVSPDAKVVLVEAAEAMDEQAAKMREELSSKIDALEETKKQAAVERVILEAGGKHVKAILALIDMDEVSYDEKKGLQGLDLEKLKEEVPYLFQEKEEKRKGTGMTKGSKQKREDEIRAAFWGLKK